MYSSEGKNLREKLGFLFDVLKRYDHYVATTNFKVALMLSFLGVIILGLITRIASIAPTQSGCNYIYFLTITSSVLTIILSIISAINLLRVVFPNTDTHDGDKSLIFFGDVATCGGGETGYAEKVKDVTDEDLVEDLSKQTYIVAKIINEKFRVLKIAVKMTIYGVIPLFAISLLLLVFEGIK
ncbi:MAG: hypothetical protein CMF14_00240 [Idiomarina sp.]|nr:hypothetical protein [Idiomarina sp.]